MYSGACKSQSLSLERSSDVQSVRAGREGASSEYTADALVIGSSPVMRSLVSDARLVAGKDVTVLISGETGTGKELIASLIHAQSRRASGPFVRFNCAAIPSGLAEAELFGHVRGAYTGANCPRQGYFEAAGGGTIVLDEVGELSPAVQPKLLRALQDGEIQPVGSSCTEKVDVRVIACTNRSLRAEVRTGRFREDLFYRLAVVELRVPSLRERREDIRALALEFVRRYSQRFGLRDATLSGTLLDRLVARDWPGNVRELESAVARMLAFSRGGELTSDALVSPLEPVDAPVERPSSDELVAAIEDAPSLRERLRAMERAIVAQTLAATHGNRSEAARRLGLSRTSFCDRLTKYELDR
jgi:two-component system response regulator AtoC